MFSDSLGSRTLRNSPMAVPGPKLEFANKIDSVIPPSQTIDPQKAQQHRHPKTARALRLAAAFWEPVLDSAVGVENYHDAFGDFLRWIPKGGCALRARRFGMTI